MLRVKNKVFFNLIDKITFFHSAVNNLDPIPVTTENGLVTRFGAMPVLTCSQLGFGVKEGYVLFLTLVYVT